MCSGTQQPPHPLPSGSSRPLRSSSEIREKAKTCGKDENSPNFCPINFLPRASVTCPLPLSLCFLGSGCGDKSPQSTFYFFSSCISCSMLFTLSLNFQFRFPHQNTFCCHWHLAAVISMDYFVSVWFGWLPKALNVTQANGAIEHLKYKFFWSMSQLHYRGLLPFMFYLFSEWCFLQAEKGF